MLRIISILILVALLPACASPAREQAAVPTVPPPTATSAPAPPTATTLPTTTPAPPTATARPTATPAPPTTTPDPWAEYAPYTIEGLRARTYGSEGEIEIVRTLEETGNFTRYLFAYTGDGLRLTGMMNRPRGDGPFPVIILAHGYYPLDEYRTGDGSRVAADYLANRGFLTLSPDFRSHAGSDNAPNLFRAGHVIDTLHLIPMAQRLPEAQPGPVGIWGHSNGGAIMAKVMTISDQIAAAVIYAPASLTIAEDYEFRVGRSRLRADRPPGERSGVLDRIEIEFPVRPEEAPDLYQRLSPLSYLRYVQAPVQIYWGTADEVVPYKWPGDLLAGLQSAGKPVEYIEYPGQPHSFRGERNQAYLIRISEFYAQYVLQ